MKLENKVTIKDCVKCFAFKTKMFVYCKRDIRHLFQFLARKHFERHCVIEYLGVKSKVTK